MVVLLFLSELEGMGMHMECAVDDMGMGEKGNPAYIEYKQGETEPFCAILQITHHDGANIGLFIVILCADGKS